MSDFILYMIDIEVPLHSALFNPPLELLPHRPAVGNFPQREVDPPAVLLQQIANEDHFGQGLIAAAQTANEGILVVDCLRCQGHFLELAQLVENVPGDLGRDQGFAVCHFFGQKVCHLDLNVIIHDKSIPKAIT